MDDNTSLFQIIQKWSEYTVQQSMEGFMHFMRENDLSFSQISVLYRIHHHGSTDIISISRELQISKAGAGQLIERMIKSGWLSSKPSKTDKRSKIIALSESGEKLVQASQIASIHWIEALIDRLPQTEKEEVIRGLNPLTEIIMKSD
jgi:DNA-binding MarR family transcriptional regulator